MNKTQITQIEKMKNEIESIEYLLNVDFAEFRNIKNSEGFVLFDSLNNRLDTMNKRVKELLK